MTGFVYIMNPVILSLTRYMLPDFTCKAGG
jgi:hypothetical protein